MKATLKFRHAIILGLCLIVFGSGLQAQKAKAKLSVEYHKIIGNDGFLSINAKFKGDDGYEPCTNLELTIYREITDDSLALMGNAITNDNGLAEYVLPSNTTTDSVVNYIYFVKIEGNSQFKNSKKKVKFMDSDLTAETILEDSVLYIKAQLTDVLGGPIKGQKIQVMVKRLFAPLTIGESYYKTDSKGLVMVPMEDSLPGIDGILAMEILLNSKKYGQVTYLFDAPIGTVIVDESTFDQRTMWSPPSKTPLFLWIFPNIVIFGIWFVIILLIMNLFKIYKS